MRLRIIAVVVPFGNLRFGVVGKSFPYVLGVPIGTMFNVGDMESLIDVVGTDCDATMFNVGDMESLTDVDGTGSDARSQSELVDGVDSDVDSEKSIQSDCIAFGCCALCSGDSNEYSFLETVPNETDLRRPRIANGKSFFFKIDLGEACPSDDGKQTFGIEL